MRGNFFYYYLFIYLKKDAKFSCIVVCTVTPKNFVARDANLKISCHLYARTAKYLLSSATWIPVQNIFIFQKFLGLVVLRGTLSQIV
jgi:hypothetical protein